ncbi:hypothetical protein LTS18_012995 [Coniosporium uncinatum]|uniref:Uncharacterized protein n=1 Tax=Coniosporium uncinatum TaxID=93489 RepID=A0ACC3D962_9PEZI|nr:hypothetical protein LTS18_012995 [Coniosporium uncinatum]
MTKDMHYEPTLNYPQMPRPPRPPKFRPSELAAVARFRSLRDRVRNGPLYTVLDENAKVHKKRKSAPATAIAKTSSFDPFTGMPTYTDRYVRKPRKLPNLHTRPYALEFFPEELHATLQDPREAKLNGDSQAAKAIRPKKLQIDRNYTTSRLDALEEEQERDPDAEDEDAEKDPDEEEQNAQDVETDYEEDEDDFGNDDYNAEQYFDGGDDDDGGDDYGGGGGDDYGEY